MDRRYLRHFALFEKSGQYALFDAKVLVIGAGGLGCCVLYNLAAAGVLNIGIVDFDRVCASNLNRQILFDINSIHKLKVDAAKNRLVAFNPDCNITTYPCKIEECPDIIKNYEIIADCCDNFEARFFVNQSCHKFKKTLVSAAVVGYAGHVMIFKSYLGDPHPCYQCFCPQEPPKCSSNSCEGAGVLGAAASAIGSIQATKIIQEILQTHTQKSGVFLRFDIAKNIFRQSQILKNKNCTICN